MATPGFLSGLTYPLRGMRFVFRTHPGLARYWIVPVVITFVAFVALVTLLLRHHTGLAASVWQPPTTDGSIGWVMTVLHIVFDWLLAIVVFALGGVGILLASSVVAAPFNDALSAAVERLEGTLTTNATTLTDFARDIARSVALELAKLVLLAAVMLPLFALNLAMPVVGGPLIAIVGPLISVSYIAIDYTDWPAARRGVGLGGRVLLFRRHTRPLIGFGVAAWALLLVPGLNLLLMPACVAGGTLLYLDLEVRGRGEASAEPAVRPAFPS